MIDLDIEPGHLCRCSNRRCDWAQIKLWGGRGEPALNFFCRFSYSYLPTSSLYLFPPKAARGPAIPVDGEFAEGRLASNEQLLYLN
jgi:hypothetical protein